MRREVLPTDIEASPRPVAHPVKYPLELRKKLKVLKTKAERAALELESASASLESVVKEINTFRRFVCMAESPKYSR
jgi:hypothetical protein